MLPVNMSNTRHLGLNIKSNSDNETIYHFDSDGSDESVNLSADEQSSECEWSESDSVYKTLQEFTVVIICKKNPVAVAVAVYFVTPWWSAVGLASGACRKAIRLLLDKHSQQ